MFPARRLRGVVLIPIAAAVAFGATGFLMREVDRRQFWLWNAGIFAAALTVSALVGMLLIAASMRLANLVNWSGAIRYAVHGALAGALCVVFVNTALTFASLHTRLFLTMGLWQMSMILLAAWLTSERSHP